MLTFNPNKNQLIQKELADDKINHLVELTQTYLGNVTEDFKTTNKGFEISFENGYLEFHQISKKITMIYLRQKSIKEN